MVRDEMKNQFKEKMKTKGKLIFVSVIILLLLIAIGVMFYKGYNTAQKKYEKRIEELLVEISNLKDEVIQYEILTKEVNISLINSEIKNIGELATIEYLYTDAGKFEDAKKLFDIKVPFTTKYFIAKWDGIIKAGIDITNVVAEEDKAAKKIIVHIPEAQILSHEIEENSIETLDEKDGLFNPITVENTREFDAACKEAMEERAIENGVLEKALENAKDIIQKLIYTDALAKQGYSIEFALIEE